MKAALALATLLAAAPAKAAESHLLVVAGLGGDPQHRDLFHEQAVALASALPVPFRFAEPVSVRFSTFEPSTNEREDCTRSVPSPGCSTTTSRA